MSPDETKAAILSDLRASFGELKCVGSERLVRLGISMTQLHVMHLLERHGEIAMSRLAEMLDVSDSAATGLIDRIEERGFVERIRVPEDRRIVLVRITPVGRQTLEDVEAVRTEVIEARPRPDRSVTARRDRDGGGRPSRRIPRHPFGPPVRSPPQPPAPREGLTP